MNQQPKTLATIAAAFAAVSLMAACDKRDNAATPPMPQTAPGTPSNSTTPGGGTTSPGTTGGTTGSTGSPGSTGSTTGGAAGGGTVPSDSSASMPGTGASR